jgi:hypothetical protein
VFINYKPTFHTKNPFRDVFETLMKNPGIVIKGGFLQKLPGAFRQAWRYHHKNEISGTAGDMLRLGAMNDGVYNLRNKNTGEFSFENDLAPLGLEGQKRNIARKIKMLALWSDFTGSIEHMTKIAGFEALKQAHPEWSEAELAYRVRRRVGTPDALEGGEWKPVLNNVFLFSNINLQGMASLAETFREAPIRTSSFIALGLLYKTPYILAKYGALPAFVGALFSALGLSGDDGEEAGEYIKKVYDSTISYYKKKYIVIPTGMEADDGTPYIFTIPRTFFGKFTSTLEYDIIEQIRKGRLSSADVFKAAGGLIPYNPESTQPVLQLAWAYKEWLAGKNPEDLYRDKPAIPKAVHGLGRVKESPYMLGWSVEKMLGDGIPKTYDAVREYATGEKNFDKGVVQNILEFPGLGRIPSQFIRKANGGIEETKRERKAELQMENRRRKAKAREEREKRKKANETDHWYEHLY